MDIAFSLHEVSDAVRWGENQLERYKNPIKSAKISGVKA